MVVAICIHIMVDECVLQHTRTPERAGNRRTTGPKLQQSLFFARQITFAMNGRTVWRDTLRPQPALNSSAALGRGGTFLFHGGVGVAIGLAGQKSHRSTKSVMDAFVH